MGCGAAGAPGRGDSPGAGERCPAACSCSRRLGRPALSEAVTPAPGSAAKRHSRVGALPTVSERDPRSALYNPRPGRARGGIGPPSARPTPPPGAPRPRPSPPPARSPLNRGGAAPLTWPWPQPPALLAPPFAAHAPCRGVSGPPPARPGSRQRRGHPAPGVRSSLCPSRHFHEAGHSGRLRLQSGAAEDSPSGWRNGRTSAARQLGRWRL